MGVTREEIFEFFKNPPEKVGMITYENSSWDSDRNFSSRFFYGYLSNDQVRMVIPASVTMTVEQKMEDDIDYESACNGPRRTIWKVAINERKNWRTKEVEQKADEFYLEFYGRNVSHEGTEYEGVRIVEPKVKTVNVWE